MNYQMNLTYTINSSTVPWGLSLEYVTSAYQHQTQAYLSQTSHHKGLEKLPISKRLVTLLYIHRVVQTTQIGKTPNQSLPNSTSKSRDQQLCQLPIDRFKCQACTQSNNKLLQDTFLLIIDKMAPPPTWVVRLPHQPLTSDTWQWLVSRHSSCSEITGIIGASDYSVRLC